MTVLSLRPTCEIRGWVYRESVSRDFLSVQAYTEKKAMVFEEVDTPETRDAAFVVVNKVCTCLSFPKLDALHT